MRQCVPKMQARGFKEVGQHSTFLPKNQGCPTKWDMWRVWELYQMLAIRRAVHCDHEKRF